jgi:hypothetical protein
LIGDQTNVTEKPYGRISGIVAQLLSSYVDVDKSDIVPPLGTLAKM